MDLTMPLYAEADAQGGPRVLVIAEIGVNHDGQVPRAKELILAAADAGADAVKFQLFHPDRLLSEQARLAIYQTDQAEDVRKLLADLTLDAQVLGGLAEAAHDAGLLFVVTPFSLEDVDDLETMGVDAVKIASPDAVNLPLLESASALDKPMLVSTGTCRLDELASAAALIRNHRAGGCLLQCVSSYPTPTPDAALGGISAMRERFDIPVGYSDHTGETFTGAFAVAAGAVVIEKHLTHDRKAKGPDHAASLAPEAFTEYVHKIRLTQKMLGPRNKTVGKLEQDVRVVSRQSVCVTRSLPAGHTLTRGDLTVKRPGTGIPAARLGELVGQRLLQPVHANHLLMPDNFAQIKSVDSVGITG